MARLPLPAGQLTELAGVAVTFQYLNRMVNIFLGESPLPQGTPAGLRGGLMRMTGKMMLALGARSPARGRVAGPAAASAAARRAVLGGRQSRASPTRSPARPPQSARPAPARSRSPCATSSSASSRRWNGLPPGLSRSWADDAVSTLAPQHRAAGRLALLTALASYQVGESDIEEFRQDSPGDEALIELTSWASLAAARRVGTWLGEQRHGTSVARAAVRDQ